ncbi:purine-nucleoside phosphorylase [Vibrio sp. TH_r3]|uniref:purine-nucleoside phosphorylase n=1 Tax=unclassified Vibrio TaxID=2614977 RepID=UPI0029550F33|nr:purine-nucleoside phosphorylase [Vibrio sp. TH_r3]MDV7105850.1 purine-nucleoside phosphorylase [Vibrio sp. TH_r3]
MSTPHINANKHDFAETIIMSGDPLRAKYIAEKYLDNVREVTNVRGILGFTGVYKSMPISVMGHGMGGPSASIYFHELMAYYGVKNIIRVGSCGAISDDVQLKDLIIAQGACTDSKINRIRFRDHDLAALANFDLLHTCYQVAKQRGVNYKVGNIFSSDLFYRPDEDYYQLMQKYGILGVEMEINALYALAAEHNCRALGICTVTDHIVNELHLSSDERQTGLNEMVEIALETALTF